MMARAAATSSRPPCRRCNFARLHPTAAAMPKLASAIAWTAVAAAGASAFAFVALDRGETVSAAWLLTAAVCTYLIAYRFYSRIIAARIFALDSRRLTPAERLNDGRE